MSDKAEKNRQHYVPKFYLRNFSPSKKSIGTFNIISRKFINRASIRNMCQKNNLYGADNKLEDVLCEMEGKAAKLIKKMILEDKIPTFSEGFKDLLIFIMVTEGRNIKMGDSIDNMIDTLYKQLMATHMEPDNLDLNNFKIGLNNRMKFMILQTLELTPLIMDLKPTLLIADSNIGKFIASDNPVVHYNPFFLFKKYSGSSGYASKGAMIFLPLSDRVCLLLYDKYTYNIDNEKVILTSATDIDEINSLIYLNSYNNVFLHPEIDKAYIDKLHENNLDYHKIGRLEEEAQEVKIVNLPGEVIKFSFNRVKNRYFKFSWFEYSEAAKKKIMPLDMQGPVREMAIYIDGLMRNKH